MGKFISIIRILVIGIIFLLAILLVSIRIVISQDSQYKQKLESWIVQKTHLPIVIKEFNVSWILLTPKLELNGLDLIKVGDKKSLLHIKQLILSIDLVDSLLRKEIVFNKINIDGLNLNIHQKKNTIILSNSRGQFIYRFNLDKSGLKAPEWINNSLNKLNIDMSHVNLLWRDKRGRQLSIKNLQLLKVDSFLSQRISGAALFSGKGPSASCDFNIQLDGDYLPFNINKSNVTINLKHFNSQLVNPYMPTLPVKFNNVLGDYTINLNISKNNIKNISIKYLLNSGRLINPTQTKQLNLSGIEGELDWQKQSKSDGASLNASGNFPATENNLRLPYNVIVYYQGRLLHAFSNKWKIISTKADVGQLINLYHFIVPNGAYLKTIKRDKPKGNVNYLMIEHTLGTNKVNQYHYEGKFNHISIENNGDTPGVNGLSAEVVGNIHSSTISVYSDNATISINRLFNHQLKLNKLTSVISVAKVNNNWSLKATKNIFSTDDFTVSGPVKLNFLNKKPPVIDLNMQISNADLTKVPDYMPVHIMDASVVKWLRNARFNADPVFGSIRMKGALSKALLMPGKTIFQIKLNHLKQFGFHYQDGWPDLKNMSADMIFDKASMFVNVKSGTISEQTITALKGSIANFAKPLLIIHGRVNGDFSKAIDFVKHSPLNQKMGDEISALDNFDGPFGLKLDLKIPLSHHHVNIKVNGKINLANNQFSINNTPLIFKHINGELNFTESGLFSKKLSGEVLGQKIYLVINTYVNHQLGKITSFVFLTKIKADSVIQNFVGFLKPFIYGESQVHGQFDILDGQKKGYYLKLYSNLYGMGVKLPEIYNKQADEKKSFVLELDASNTPFNLVSLVYGKLASLALRFNLNNSGQQLYSMNLHLGKGKAKQQDKPGLLVDGLLPNLTYQQVSNAWRRYKGGSEGSNIAYKNLLKEIRSINLNFKKVELGYHQVLTDVSTQISFLRNSTGFLIHSDQLSGKINYNNNGSIDADLEHLNLVVTKKLSSTAFKLPADKLPALSLTVKDFSINKDSYGGLSLDVSPEIDGLKINKINLTNQYGLIALSGNLSTNSVNKITGFIKSTNLGNLLSQQSITNYLSDGSGRIDFSLNWFGNIYPVKPNTLNGSVNFYMANGRLINLGENVDAEFSLNKLLNLFSLDALPKRLLLNFDDIKPGISFSSLTGNLAIDKGVVSTNKISLAGPLVSILFKGMVNLPEKLFDAELLVFPYITSSVPTLALVTLGPLAGAITWTVNKMTSSTISKSIEYHYKVTGPFKKPIMTKLNE